MESAQQSALIQCRTAAGWTLTRGQSSITSPAHGGTLSRSQASSLPHTSLSFRGGELRAVVLRWMERARDCGSSAGMLVLGVLLGLWPALDGVWGFNLHAKHPTVYRGPGGSYFGYSVDFYQDSADSNT